ncbi:MAG: hypothetical protein VX335_01915 [Pseudomonadota bacterium]|nr:hypothetical protein [Pseudomonadota bacterium]
MLRKTNLKPIIASSILLFSANTFAAINLNGSIGKALVPENNNLSSGKFSFEGKAAANLSAIYSLDKLKFGVDASAFDGSSSVYSGTIGFELLDGLTAKIGYQGADNDSNSAFGKGNLYGIDYVHKNFNIGITYGDFDENSNGFVCEEYGVLFGMGDISLHALKSYYDNPSDVEDSVMKYEISYAHKINENLSIHPTIYYAESMDNSSSTTSNETGFIGSINYKF